MAKTFHDGKITLHAGDCLDVLKAMPENSIDAVVTDPPYHLTSIVKRFARAKPENEAYAATSKSAYMSRGFMGKQWDGGDIAFRPELWAEVLRVLKPGGHMVCFGGTRTYHRMVCAIEDAGFEVRDQLAWVYGSGFPKSHDIAKQIDKGEGFWRGRAGAIVIEEQPSKGREYERNDKGDPITDAARQWQGYGTALKPSWEPICLARKPLSESTVAANVLRWGTGALNIDKCRIFSPSSPQAAVSASERLSRLGSLLDTASVDPDCGLDIVRRIAFELQACSNGDKDRQHNGAAQNGIVQEDDQADETLLCRLLANASSYEADWWSVLNSQADCRPLSRFGDGRLRAIREAVQDGLASLGDVLSRMCKEQFEPTHIRDHQSSDHPSILDDLGLAVSLCQILVAVAKKNTTGYSAPQQGRWPPNLAHDGSPEVLAGFPDSDSSEPRIPTCSRLRQSGFAMTDGSGGFGDSGSAARFFYTAKAGSWDRINRVIESLEIEWNTGQKQCRAVLPVDTEQLHRKGIVVSASGTSNEWNTFLSGSNITDLCRKASKCTIKTATSSTTTSQTWSWLTRLLTNESIRAANYETANGSSHAETAETSGPSLIITLGETASLPGASLAMSGTRLRISVSAKQHGHPTIKPVNLMQWLVRLVCPKGATVLDLFAGTGTTGAASFIEGRRCVLIEREAEYLADIEKRMGMLLMGSEERSWKLAKPEPLEALPLFALPEPAELATITNRLGDLNHRAVKS